MTSSSALPVVALATGDPAGIGPELCLKAAVNASVRAACRPLLYGDPSVIRAHRDLCGIAAALDVVGSLDALDWTKPGLKLIARDQFSDSDYVIAACTAANGRAIIDTTGAAIDAALNGDVAAVVAAPQNETSVHMAGIEFDGYPSFVARRTGRAADDVYLMLCFDRYKIAHCTLHASVRRSLDMITTDRVGRVIRAVHETLQRIGLVRPRIVVAGLNPHAGEGGLFGSEDGEIIAPAIATAAAHGIDVTGPVPADLMLHRTGVDAFVVMLHDQGHIPAKLVAPHRTSALSIGSPILFSSVAHGSAHDIAGKGVADPSAMIDAILRVTGGRI